MIKRTPQEIADFFGCYVAQDEAGCFMIYSEKPEFVIEDEVFGVKNVWVMANKPEGVFEYITNLVDVPKDHDFHILYKPNLSENPTGSVGSAETEQTTKAPHQSEVHVHRDNEYMVVTGGTPEYMNGLVSEYMTEDGWRPQGGVYYHDGVYYQAMVRGV